MPTNQKSFIRRLFPTCHKLLLDRLTVSILPQLAGRILVVGAGYDNCKSLLPLADSIITVDLISTPSVDIVADVQSLPFDSNSFDHIVCLEVVEHVYDLQAAASEMIRITRPGGKIVVSSPFLFRIHGDPLDFRRLTIDGLSFYFSPLLLQEHYLFGNRLTVIYDLITTSSWLLVPFRLGVHLLYLFPSLTSRDCPSGIFAIFFKTL